MINANQVRLHICFFSVIYMFSKINTFPQCTPYNYAYTDIYHELKVFANSCIYSDWPGYGLDLDVVVECRCTTEK